MYKRRAYANWPLMIPAKNHLSSFNLQIIVENDPNNRQFRQYCRCIITSSLNFCVKNANETKTYTHRVLYGFLGIIHILSYCVKTNETFLFSLLLLFELKICLTLSSLHYKLDNNNQTPIKHLCMESKTAERCLSNINKIVINFGLRSGRKKKKKLSNSIKSFWCDSYK